MLPVRLVVDHYRSLRSCDVALCDYTAIVGPNGVGKSTVMQALSYFMDPGRAALDGDFHEDFPDEDVVVSVTFDELNAEEQTAHAAFLDSEGTLTVMKRSRADGAVAYEAAGMRHPAFADLWALRSTKSAFNDAVKAFAQANPDYKLSFGASAESKEAELRRWEAENPQKCVETRVPFSFGVAPKGHLMPTTRVVYVPAVREAAQTLAGARSPLAQLVTALVYPRVEERADFLALRERTQADYRKLFPLDGAEDLGELSKLLTGALEEFVPGASVALSWDVGEPQIEPPDVVPAVAEDGVNTAIGHQGHGLQRALIIAMLQAEDEHRRSGGGGSPSMHVVLMIEEPELYQHPPRARHFRRVLHDLTARPRAGAKMRVIVTTHSPEFVSLQTLDEIRMFRRVSVPGKAPARSVSSVTLEEVAAAYAAASGKSIDVSYVRRSLHVVNAVFREAFFASAVVLVEGVGDVGFIVAECEHAGVDLEARGIVVLPCDGKSKMLLAVSMLDLFDIKHFVIFDSDLNDRSGENRGLLTSLGATGAENPTSGVPPTTVRDQYAILNPKLEVVATAEYPSAYATAVKAAADVFGIDSDKIMKNPVTAKHAIDLIHTSCPDSKIFSDVISRIRNLPG